MKPSDLIRLRHMREAAQAALAFAEGKSRDTLETDLMLVFALVLEKIVPPEEGGS